MHILGISALFHDAAAAVVTDGVVVAAAQEERFTRTKHDADMPVHAMAFALARAGVAPGELDAVVFYDKPISTFARVLGSALQVAPRGFGQFRRAMPTWFRSKLWVRLAIEDALQGLGHPLPDQVLFLGHHESHAGAAFHPSPFDRAAVICFDGVGEWATTSIWHGKGNRLEPKLELRFPDSLGLLYSAFTQLCGFAVNDGEYKLMGLAPYGQPTYADEILSDLVQLAPDGSFTLDRRSLGYLTGDRMTNKRFEDRFGGAARHPDAPLTTRELDLARSIQVVTEEIVLRIAQTAAEVTGEHHACLAGGVALNCVSNARLRREGPFDDIWVQPAAGDAGSALGAALQVWHHHQGNDRHPAAGRDSMSGTYLGPAFADDEIRAWLAAQGIAATELADPDQRAQAVAERLADGQAIGMFQGRMEFGPRALGNRSILADPRDPAMASRLNLATKGRESFRPFAPVVPAEVAADWFDLPGPSPHMTFTAPVLGATPVSHPVDPTQLHQLLGSSHPTLPAITHVDGSARVQTVDAATNGELHRLLLAFGEQTGCPILVNTSFNVAGEPIVCTPEEALACMRASDLDAVLLGSHLVDRVAARS